MNRERTVSGSQEGKRLVATDVFLHNLEPYALEALRRVMEQGLTPSGLEFGGDANSIVIIRFARPASSAGRPPQKDRVLSPDLTPQASP